MLTFYCVTGMSLASSALAAWYIRFVDANFCRIGSTSSHYSRSNINAAKTTVANPKKIPAGNAMSSIWILLAEQNIATTL